MDNDLARARRLLPTQPDERLTRLREYTQEYLRETPSERDAPPEDDAEAVLFWLHARYALRGLARELEDEQREVRLAAEVLPLVHLWGTGAVYPNHAYTLYVQDEAHARCPSCLGADYGTRCARCGGEGIVSAITRDELAQAIWCCSYDTAVAEGRRLRVRDERPDLVLLAQTYEPDTLARGHVGCVERV